jgi:hypothetical protein
MFDPDYGVALCAIHHKTDPEAPHVDNDKFFDKIIPRLPSDRRAKVLAYQNLPKQSVLEKIDWKLLKFSLQQQLNELEQIAWMDD